MYKIKLIQDNPIVGDIKGNFDLAVKHITQAISEKTDLVIFSEMFLTGYPPEDLLLREDFIKDSEEYLEKITKLSDKISIIIGSPIKESDEIFNSAVFLSAGKLSSIYKKKNLPNYKEFDEKRYFKNGEENKVFEDKGLRFGITICEDIWDEKVVEDVVSQKIDILLNISASPFTTEKKNQRETMLSKYFLEYKVPMIYVNQVGGQDELVFDGSSLIIGAKDKKLIRLKSFEVDQCLVSYDENLSCERTEDVIAKANEISDTYNALVLGTKDYVNKNNFNGVIIGSSGGIDSALTTTIACDALGPESVQTVMMPFKYTAEMSLQDAKQLASNLKISHREIPILEMFNAFKTSLESSLESKDGDKTDENLQSRCRGVTLMALSNNSGSLVLATGNKSESAVGYSTLYGDTAGGFSVIRDVDKTTVYDLAKYRNSINQVIPERIITREPSAELAPDQKDTDTLPPYEILDPIIRMYVEEDKNKNEIVSEGFSEEDVIRIIRLVDLNEYKRRQVPLGIKISPRNFGKDRRYPITNLWNNKI